MNAKNNNFMSPAYALIQEPLNLLEESRTWLKDVHQRHVRAGASMNSALVLGATPWLTLYCAERYESIISADMSRDMLDKTEKLFKETGNQALLEKKVKLVQTGWQDLPMPACPYDFIVGDNSLPFVPYSQWKGLLQRLHMHSSREALFLHRFFAAPSTNWLEQRSSVERLILTFNGRVPSSTELRATLMFSQWKAKQNGLDVESAAMLYEDNRDTLHSLLKSHDSSTDDLSTIRKYKGTGLFMSSPHFEEILEDLHPHFHVKSVDYGNYPLKDFFPLISSVRL